MSVRFYVLLSAGLLAASAAVAQTRPSAPDVAEAQGDQMLDAKDKVECRNEEISGSRVRRVKVCKTLAQWEEQGRRAQEGWKRQNRSAPGVGGQTLPRPGG